MLPVAVLLVVAAAGVVDAAPALSRLERTTTTSTAKKGAIKAKIHSHAKGNRSGLGRRDITDITNWNHDMMYSVEVAAGTPQQTFRVTLDTGSPDLWLMASSCTAEACTGQPLFEGAASTTYWSAGKQLALSYSSGPITGTWGTDQVTFDNETFVSQEFGVIANTSITQFKTYQTQGVMGLSWKVENHPVPFWQNMFDTDAYYDEGFGIYLERDIRPDTASLSGPGGEFIFGGYDDSLYVGNLNWLPLKRRDLTFWTVELDIATVNGVDIAATMGNMAVIDTGTSLTYGNLDVVAQLYAQIPNVTAVPSEKSVAYTFPCADVTHMDISFTFGADAYHMYPGDLFYSKDADGITCWGSIVGMQISDLLGIWGVEWVFGANFLKNVYTGFAYYPEGLGFARLRDEFNIRNPDLLLGATPTATSTSSAAVSSTATSSEVVSSTASPSATPSASSSDVPSSSTTSSSATPSPSVTPSPSPSPSSSSTSDLSSSTTPLSSSTTTTTSSTSTSTTTTTSSSEATASSVTSSATTRTDTPPLSSSAPPSSVESSTASSTAAESSTSSSVTSSAAPSSSSATATSTSTTFSSSATPSSSSLASVPSTSTSTSSTSSSSSSALFQQPIVPAPTPDLPASSAAATTATTTSKWPAPPMRLPVSEPYPANYSRPAFPWTRPPGNYTANRTHPDCSLSASGSPSSSVTCALPPAPIAPPIANFWDFVFSFLRTWRWSFATPAPTPTPTAGAEEDAPVPQ